MRLANLVVAGVVKGGTTSAFAYLARHPHVGACSVKEPGYFLMQEPGRLEKYARLFSHIGTERYVIEGSAGYFWGGEKVAERLCDTLGDDSRVILILREPVERLVSYFKYQKSRLEIPEGMTFESYIQACDAVAPDDIWKRDRFKYFSVVGGCYDLFLEPWLRVYGERLLVTFFDELRANPRGWLEHVAAWLGLDLDLFPNAGLETENKTVNYRSATLQRVALLINHHAEPFWRRHHGLKSTLRQVYYYINGRPFEEELNAATLEALRKRYSKHNLEAGRLLECSGYHDMPRWLRPQL